MPNRPELIAMGVALRKPRLALSVGDSASVGGPRSTMLLAFFMPPQHVDLAGASASPLALSLPRHHLCVKRIILIRVITLRAATACRPFPRRSYSHILEERAKPEPRPWAKSIAAPHSNTPPSMSACVAIRSAQGLCPLPKRPAVTATKRHCRTGSRRTVQVPPILLLWFDSRRPRHEWRT